MQSITISNQNTIDTTKNTFYGKYLRSTHWDEVRKETYKRNNFCSICGSQDTQLNIHHLTYKDKIGNSNLYNERINDLTVLCRDCHTCLHSYYGNRPQTISKIKKLSKLYRKLGNLNMAIVEHRKGVNTYLRKKNVRVKKPTLKAMGTMAFFVSQRQDQVLN
ncbi:MAG: HNH endonuclease [Candidatus Roizmanbacteria bacterium]|nr:HNH endonuclease [Candidatus Roizmanbacteria bacterium]